MPPASSAFTTARLVSGATDPSYRGWLTSARRVAPVEVAGGLTVARVQLRRTPCARHARTARHTGSDSRGVCLPQRLVQRSSVYPRGTRVRSGGRLGSGEMSQGRWDSCNVLLT